MAIEYEVWGRPPDEPFAEYVLTYPRHRWQWACKARAYLRERGYTHLEVRRVETEDDAVPEKEENHAATG